MTAQIGFPHRAGLRLPGAGRHNSMLSQNLGAVPVQRIEQSPADQRLCENVIEARLGGPPGQQRVVKA
ncbi:hypothetical protein [Sphingobium yanoikuyae]|uniref:hypothetical protein n=1 Tax=Sphingobium yanoikuyae TaxID=13690 RepID=UPI00192E3C19|nr:hypothetical protein [Sphingobium yanoikuyae]